MSIVGAKSLPKTIRSFLTLDADTCYIFLYWPAWWNGRHWGLKIPSPFGGMSSSLIVGSNHNRDGHSGPELKLRRLFMSKYFICHTNERLQNFGQESVFSVAKDGLAYILLLKAKSLYPLSIQIDFKVREDTKRNTACYHAEAS